KLPLAQHGTPDKRSPARYLLWLASGQVLPLVSSTTCGIAWMVSNALMPMAIGMVIDSLFGAVQSKAPAAQSEAWLLLLALAVVQTVTSVGTPRSSNEIARLASFRTIQIVIGHVADVGAAMRPIASDDAATISAVDIVNIGEVMMVTGRAAGAFTSFLVV